LDKWVDREQSFIQGAMTSEATWQFGSLDRATKQITQELHLYRVLGIMS
jgi:hypothetical protein